MADPVDPYEGLRLKQVRDRAAAVREFSRTGSWEDIEPLVELAKGDKSPSVRLYAAAAASDIACRHRGAAGQTPLSIEQRTRIIDWLKGVDPNKAPGLLMLLASSADKRNFDRLGRALRDPSNVVRAGAVAAVRRMALSAAAMDEPRIAEAVGTWLDHPKLPAEITLELAKLIGECGWTGFDARLRKAAGAGRPHVAAVDEVFGLLAERNQPGSWEGVWASSGHDVFEPGDEGIADWFLISDGQAHTPGKKRTRKLVVEEGSATLAGKPARWIVAPRGAAGPQRALQTQGFTYWRLDGKKLVGALEALLPGIEKLGEDARPIAEWYAATDGAVAARAHAVVLATIGALDDAREALDTLTGVKKPRNDLWFWLGKVAAAQSDAKTAKKALGQFLEKAGKKAQYRKEAEKLLASL